MGELIRSKDWSATPLGPIETWPQSLRTTVSLCLASNFPINLIWGPHHVQIYNDGYRPICAAKHPKSLGEDYTKTWATAWEILDDAFQRALSGETSYLENRRMFLDRNGYLEETFFTFSLSPIRDESGEIGGLFHPVTETTLQMLSQRRTRSLQDLASRTSQAKNEQEACALAAEALADNQLDLPFTLIYLVNQETGQPKLAASAHLPQATTNIEWPFAEATRTGTSLEITPLLEPIHSGPYPESPHRALLIPILIAGLEGPAGFLVAAVSPRLPFTDEYRGFIDLAAATLTAAIVNARAYEAERKRAEKLAELDQAKTTFFSNVSHEFRTPLTLILGPLQEMLSQRGDQLSITRGQVDLVHRNGLRLLRLVNTLLDFSRIEANRVQATYQPTDLPSLTRDIASTFRSAIESAGLTFQVNCPELPEHVYLDHEMWEKIVLNLLSNAFKFTFKGSIAVELRDAGQHIEFSVADTGTGIPAQELPLIFQRFHRVQGAQGRTYEGTGIGLALVGDLIKLHGGTVSVDSEMGQGTTFRIFIPKGFQHLPAAQVTHQAHSAAATGSLVNMFVEESLRWTASDAPPADAATKLRRILLADDNSDMREYIRTILATEFEVRSASNGAEALRIVPGWLPDLVLTDVMMPELDGFGLLRELRQDKRTQGIPVIMLSARAGEESRIEGIQSGADDYLVKPFNAKELMARVRINLELSQLRHELAREAEQLRGLDEKDRQWRLFDTALSHTPDSIYVFNPQGRFAYSNQAFQKRWGKSFSEILGRKLTELDYPPDVAAQLQHQLNQVIQQREGLHGEASLLDAEGRRHYFDYALMPVFSNDGELEAVAGTTRDITEWKENNRALSEANADLEQFAYAAAHDLQEPLRNVGLAAQILASRYKGRFDADADGLLKAATDGSIRMQAMVKDLLAYSRALKAGEDEVAMADSDAVLSLALHNLQAAIEEKHAHISYAHLPPVRMSEVHLLQVFQNLVSNSLKYSGPHEPHVEIAAAERDGTVVFCVRDNGLGIPPEFHGRAFGIFKRLHNRDAPGTGIGLALCKRIVEHYGGKIWIESDGQQGSALLFTPPLVNQP
jgi:PAS domain S-box-containing protein